MFLFFPSDAPISYVQIYTSIFMFLHDHMKYILPDNFFFSIDQTVEKQAENLKAVSSKYEHDKKVWMTAISGLEEKIKVFHIFIWRTAFHFPSYICNSFIMELTGCKLTQNMKEEHAQLAHNAHECADSIPDLSNMVLAVQMLGRFGLKSHISFPFHGC